LLRQADSEDYESRGRPVTWDRETGETKPLPPTRTAPPRPAVDPAAALVEHRVTSQTAIERRAAESARMSGMLKAISKRQAKGNGWNGIADNDNLDFPLLKVLRGAGIADDMFVVMKSDKLGGAADADELIATGKMPNGEIKRKGQRVSEAAHHDLPPKQKRSTDSDAPTVGYGVGPVAKKWNGDDALIAAIDGKPVLAELHAAMGPLHSAFDDAALYALKLEDIGAKGGIGNPKGAMGAGRYAVFAALQELDDTWRAIDERQNRRRATG
jgi:hypothetical protein